MDKSKGKEKKKEKKDGRTIQGPGAEEEREVSWGALDIILYHTIHDSVSQCSTRLATSVTGGEEGGEPLTRPGLSTIGDVNHGREKGEEELSCKPGPSSVDGIGEGEGRSSINPQSSEVTSLKDGISCAGGDKSSSPSDPGLSGVSGGGGTHHEHHQSTDFVPEQNFPDITNFPDSAFSGSQSPQHVDTNEGGRGEEERRREEDSSNGGDSSSSWRESEGESDSTDLPEVAWSPNQQSKTSYTYTKLGDLQAGLKKAHVIGVVKEFNEPRVTRGTEYCTILTLLDETDPLVGVKCVLFNTEKERLPHVKREGDIICLHRVNTHDYRNVMQIEGPPYSSSLRFSSRVGRKMKPCTGSLSYTFTATERRRVRELRQWLQQRRTEHDQRMDTICGGQKCNLLCQVVWVAHFGSTDQTIVSVWDGTVCPLVIKSFDTAGADMCCDAGLNVVVGPKLQRQVIIKGSLSPSLKLEPCSYIHISNIEASAPDKDGVIELCLDKNPQENIKIISASDSGYSELLERLEAGLASQRGVAITTTIHNDIPLSTLVELKDHDIDEAVPGKCHSLAKLVHVLTPTIEETVWLKCESCSLFKPIPRSMRTEPESGACLDPCPRCSRPPTTSNGSPSLHCMFLIKVLLADHTASLKVYIPQDEIGTLFGDLTATNLYQHQTPRYRLMAKFYQLSGGNPPFSEEIGSNIQPWIDCCLIKMRDGEEVLYAIFDTTLK